MTQSQARINLDRFDEYILLKWPKWSVHMKWIAMQSRRGLIEQLQVIQLKEFQK